MDKSVANDEQKANDPRLEPDEETVRLFKILEDAQNPIYPGCKSTVQEFINEFIELKVTDENMTDEGVNQILSMTFRMLPKGNKLAQFNNMKKVDELLRAQMLMHELKSEQIPYATSGQDMLLDTVQGGAKPITAAKSGTRKGKGKKASNPSITPK